MTIKELIIEKINNIPEEEPILQEVLQILEKRKPTRTFKGRPLLRPADLKNMENDLPPEPEWEKIWNEEKNK